MYIVCKDEIHDEDLEQLRKFLNVLDAEYEYYSDKRKNSYPPEQNIYWERIYYLAGLSFVMCQQYINITYPWSGLSKEVALSLPPKHKSGHSVIELINSGANFWKHYHDKYEWDENEINNSQPGDTVYPKCGLFKSVSKFFVDFGLELEAGFQNCEVILDAIVATENKPFTTLLNFLIEWRNSLINNSITSKEKPEGHGRLKK